MKKKKAVKKKTGGNFNATGSGKRSKDADAMLAMIRSVLHCML